MLFSQINLPWFILLHALGLCTLGLHLVFPFTKSKPTQKNQQSSLLGIATLGLGLAYLSTSYMPMEQNVFLYATVPVRLILAFVAGIKAVVGGDTEEKGGLWGVAVYDGGGAIVLGLWLGSWGGRIPGLLV